MQIYKTRNCSKQSINDENTQHKPQIRSILTVLNIVNDHFLKHALLLQSIKCYNTYILLLKYLNIISQTFRKAFRCALKHRINILCFFTRL